MDNKRDANSCFFSGVPCNYLKIVGSVSFAIALVLVPFSYTQSVKIERNTDAISKIQTMQVELRSNTEAIIRFSVILEGMQKSLNRLEINEANKR